jgi:uncharacterized membrane protein YgaE (UPF0421/DUF939 family)
MPSILYRTIKITIGVILAIFLSEWFQLEFALSAGVITLLSMMDMKKQSLGIAFKRIYSALLALFIASVLFALFHFSLWSLGLFLLIYIPILLKLNASVGLVVNTVLISHIYSLSEITVSGILNEVFLMMIGISIALLFNLHMPNKEEEIIELQRTLEEQLRSFLRALSFNLKNNCEINGPYATLMDLKQTIDEGINKAIIFINSFYFKENSYYLLYFEMRKHQYGRLRYMQEHCNAIFVTEHEAGILSDCTFQLATEISEFNTGEATLHILGELRTYFKGSDLPKTREEFENRASLYQYLNDLEEFVLIKIRFVETLGKKARI